MLMDDMAGTTVASMHEMMKSMLHIATVFCVGQPCCLANRGNGPLAKAGKFKDSGATFRNAARSQRCTRARIRLAYLRGRRQNRKQGSQHHNCSQQDAYRYRSILGWNLFPEVFFVACHNEQYIPTQSEKQLLAAKRNSCHLRHIVLYSINHVSHCRIVGDYAT